MSRIKLSIVQISLFSMVMVPACQIDDIVVDENVWVAENVPGPKKVGELVTEGFVLPKLSPSESGIEEMAWSRELHDPGASYIAVHFSWFDLPDGARLIIRDPDNTRVVIYTGKGKDIHGMAGFWATHMPGDRTILELHTQVAVPAAAVRIDHYARGTEAFKEFADQIDVAHKAICGSDDSQWAKCLQSSEPKVYDRARAVARLMINGTGACTGWLVGSEGHLMTNEHCIDSASDAANTDYEFMAEGGTCSTNCASWGGCPGAVGASSATLVQVDADLDYALLRLPTNVSSTYGYLQMRRTGGVVGERIYIPQHPSAWGKRIATKAGSSNAVITSLNEPGCSSSAVSDVGYFADTQGGSSGSPVIAYSDHSVVALHHCANCPNRGVPIDRIIDDLEASDNLPKDAVNLALGGSTTASSTYCSGSGLHCYHAYRINDGDRDTTVGGYYSWANAAGLPAWVKVDFGTTRAFNRVKLYTSSGYPIRNYKIQYWTGSSWSNAATITGNTSTERTHTFSTKTSSQVRVLGELGPSNQSVYVRVNELEVYDDGCTPNSCQFWQCGFVSNGCGGTMYCGSCCGNGICAGSESCQTCPLDCGSCNGFCGDGFCNGVETPGTCPQDCCLITQDGLEGEKQYDCPMPVPY